MDKMDDVLQISSSRIIHWMNVIRDCSNEERYRLLENFWDSQVRSKSWIINTLKTHIPHLSGRVYIMGGWYGILSQLIVDNFPTSVFNIDKDENCIRYGKSLSDSDWKIYFLTRDMGEFSSYLDPKLIINTSTEHITQETYDKWMHNVPYDVPIIIQGNNFYDCYDHIRCYDTLEEFNENNYMGKIIFTGQLECRGPEKPFHRFMTLGYK
jgi:hypothetical protein